MNRLSHERLLKKLKGVAPTRGVPRSNERLVRKAAGVWCNNGFPYATKADAKAALRSSRALPDTGKPRPVRFYRCAECAQFHLTSRESTQHAAEAKTVSTARRKAGCVKVANLTESSALSSLINIADGRPRDRYPRCAYQCRRCGMYHLSSWVPQPQQGPAS